MANLTVRIVVRAKDAGGRRTWVPATGKGDPAGPYYIRYCEGRSPRYLKAGNSYAEAEVAQLRQERRLKAASIGAVLPEEPYPSNPHRCVDALAAYLAVLGGAIKRNGRRYNRRAIRAREANIREFLELSGRVYIEQITRDNLLRYRDHLYSQGRANDTTYNKMAVILTWLKHNPIRPVTGLLKPQDWPVIRQTKPHPFREDEIAAIMDVAGEHRLLLRLALGTGMRKAELMHAERADIDPHAKTIRVANKPKYGWETKTTPSNLIPGTDKPYASILAGVKSDLGGRDIDFSKQSDREAIGNAVIKHIRDTGGCDVNGADQPGCPQ